MCLRVRIKLITHRHKHRGTSVIPWWPQHRLPHLPCRASPVRLRHVGALVDCLTATTHWAAVTDVPLGLLAAGASHPQTADAVAALRSLTGADTSRLLRRTVAGRLRAVAIDAARTIWSARNERFLAWEQEAGITPEQKRPDITRDLVFHNNNGVTVV